MGKGTNIEWADDTVNPTSGCDGCELFKVLDPSAAVPDGELPRGGGPCYAGNLHEKRLARSLPGLYASNFFEVHEIPGRMRKAVNLPDLWGTERRGKPWLNGLPRLIFVGDLGDIFSKAISFAYLFDEVMASALSEKGRQHAQLWLTKQPRRAAEFARWMKESRGYDWPANVWTGTSITGRASLSRIDALLEIPGNHFLSVEPLVEDVTDGLRKHLSAGIDWLIVGGESSQWGLQARPFDLAWARSIRDLCRAAGVLFFVKQLGSRPYEWEPCGLAPGSIPSAAIDAHLAAGGSEPDDEQRWLELADRHGGDMAEWPEDLRIREMPERSLFRAA